MLCFASWRSNWQQDRADTLLQCAFRQDAAQQQILGTRPRPEQVSV